MVCPNCGAEVPAGQKFCGECGTVMPEVEVAPTGEEIYFQDDIVTITRARAILGAKTFAMANITSVTMGKIEASITPVLILILIGIVVGICVATQNTIVGAVLGALFVAAGIAVAVTSKASYVVKLGSSSGEQDALVSPQREYIEKIVAALNQAIIGRG